MPCHATPRHDTTLRRLNPRPRPHPYLCLPSLALPVGMLRSHLTCPVCNHESVTFDPYMSLSLPIAGAGGKRGAHASRKIEVTVMRLPPGTPPTTLWVAVPLQGNVEDLREAVAEGRKAREVAPKSGGR